MKWYLKVLRQYADFSGRARREEYWKFVLYYVIFALVAITLDILLHYPILYLFYILALMIPSIALQVRRLHDTGRSGWWLLIGLIPLIGAIVLFVFSVSEGDSGENFYGPDPKSEGEPDQANTYVPPSEFIELPFQAATLSTLKCPQCDSGDYIPLGKKGAIGKAIATQLFVGGIGNIISARSHAQNISHEPLRYRCKQCKTYYLAEPSVAPPEEHLPEPCLITLQRTGNLVGAALPQVVYLNGVQIAPVKNGKTISFHTWVKENVLFLTVQAVAFPDVRFTAEPGGSTVIFFNRKVKKIYHIPKTPPPSETNKAARTQPPAPEAEAVRNRATFDDNGRFVEATLPAVSWNRKFSGDATYFSCQAPTLFQATEILRDLSSIRPNTYYVVDTPDGSLGRDLHGFYTEARIKSHGILPETHDNRIKLASALSLTAFGNVVQNQSSVALLKSVGQYASFILQMECGHCGYSSPVETIEGDFERQCYACGTVNKTQRGQIQVYTPQGIVAI
jgi:uncharacterized membrane protein YhaH (DUF805 family)